MEKTKDKLDIELPTVEEITLQDAELIKYQKKVVGNPGYTEAALEAAHKMVSFEDVPGYLTGIIKGIYIGAKRYAGIQKPPQQ